MNANDVSNVDKANAGGILTLEKLGVIELIKKDGSTFALVNPKPTGLFGRLALHRG